jgi:fused signal recognition particle receptor
MAGTKGLWERFREGLRNTREHMRRTRLGLGGGRARADLLEEVEGALLAADVGVRLTETLLGRLADVRGEEIPSALRTLLLEAAGPAGGFPAPLPEPYAVVLVGVNGAGKTTTAAKLAWQLAQTGRSVLLGAADTFRAAAAEQLALWADRVGADLVRHQEGGDPAAVAHDAIEAALRRGRGAVIIDTAGRLHTKEHLMEELGKVLRVSARALGRPVDDVLLVLDAVTGQNAVQQARVFREAVPLTGIVVTKLDGSARGGSVLAARGEIGVPIRWLGLGEGVGDLAPFDPEAFVAALLEGVFEG